MSEKLSPADAEAAYDQAMAAVHVGLNHLISEVSAAFQREDRPLVRRRIASRLMAQPPMQNAGLLLAALERLADVAA